MPIVPTPVIVDVDDANNTDTQAQDVPEEMAQLVININEAKSAPPPPTPPQIQTSY